MAPLNKIGTMRKKSYPPAPQPGENKSVFRHQELEEGEGGGGGNILYPDRNGDL